MIYFCNANGTTELVQSTPIYQGSSLASNITVVAPFPSYLEVTIAFKLPNGTVTQPSRMTSVPLGGSIKIGNVQANAWQYLIESSITEYAGTVQVQFYFYNSNSILASYSSQFQVQRGVQAELPTTPDQDIYDEILGYLSTVNDGIGYGIKSVGVSVKKENLVTNYETSVLECTLNDDYKTFVNNTIAGTDENGIGAYPYYSDYMSYNKDKKAMGLTGSNLRNGLQNIDFNIQNNKVVYDPEEQFLKDNPMQKFTPYGISLNWKLNYPNDIYPTIGNLIIYTDIMFYGQKDENNEILVPDRYQITIKYISSNGTKTDISYIDYPSLIVPFVLKINKKNVKSIELKVINGLGGEVKSSGCLPIYGLLLTNGQEETLTYNITTYGGYHYQLEIPVITGQLAEINNAKDYAITEISNAQQTAVNAVNDAKETALADIGTQVANAEASAENAAASAEKAEDEKNNATTAATLAEISNAQAQKALNDLTSKGNQVGGYPVLEDIDGQPKIPSVLINQVDIKEYIEIQNESQLATVEAQPGDVAFLTETINGEKTVTKSWILLSVENNIRNWAVFGTSYATNAGNAVQAETATNALQINGVIYKSVTESEYNDLIDKSGIYFVTYPNATSENGTSESGSEIL